MASRVIYPPILNSYMPAFVVKDEAKCRVYFSLSKFNSRSDFKSVHISIIKQGSGASVVNKIDAAPRFRSTGIILNAKPVKVDNNLYYVDINSEDIRDGWTIGWIYKVQIRLSSVDYDESIKQPAWLNANGNNFSEWSTVCTIKAIGENIITIPNFNYNSLEKNENINIALSLSTLSIVGTYQNLDISEMLYSYQIKILKNNNILEQTDIIYSNQYINSNQFKYLVQNELDEGDYVFELSYETNNKYQGIVSIPFSIKFFNLKEIPATLLTAETGAESTVYAEEEEGRIALQIYSEDKDTLYGGNICIRRASAADNFKKWEDIKIISVNYQNLNKIGLIYDYTAVSGIEYYYAIQAIDEYGTRGQLQKIASPIKREYQFSYLLGENGQQLKLKFDNTLSNFKIAVSDTKIDTIGSKYPFITRNGNMKYKNFSLNGLISYNMDEANLFLPKDFLGRVPEGLYDYTYEREFRNEVLNFLYSDKPRLYKSPTEGNILVRIMDVQATPNKSLNRMIFSFSANAIEIEESTLENYKYYNLVTVGDIKSDYNIIGEEEHIGQISGKYILGENILSMIYNKYTKISSENTKDKVIKIKDVVITINDNPLSIGGWIFQVNNNQILLKSPINVFSPEIIFNPLNDVLYINQGDSTDPTTLNITIDFIYVIKKSYIKEKLIQNMTYEKIIGQLCDNYSSNTSLYEKIKEKYFIEWDTYFRYAHNISSLVIEANLGTTFLIKYQNGTTSEVMIGATGILALNNTLNIIDLIYINMDGNEIDADITINYNCYIATGYYKEEEAVNE